jgi:signal transduction histidine kinase
MAAELPQSESTAPFAPELFLANQPVTRYALALGLTLLALLVRWLINPVLGDLGPFLSVYAAVTLAAVYLGAGPATLTALLGLVGSSRWFLLQGQLKFESSDLAYSAGFLLVSSIIILLAERSRRALLQVEAARQTLEAKVGERTRELQVALANLQAEIRVRAEAEEARRRISARMLNIQDEERRRIARELHDSIGQTLAALKMTASTLSKMTSATAPSSPPSSPAVSKCWDDVNSLIDEAIRETRTISHLLHPPMLDEIGFAASASWYITGFARRSGIEVKVELPEDQPRFTEAIDLTLFRALQECLTNILRHSGSKKAEVRLDIGGQEVVLSVRDYGKGMSREQIEKFMTSGTDVGVGLGGMRERVRDLGGKIELQTPGTGTAVKVTLPLVMATPKAPDRIKPSGAGLAAPA